MTRTKRTRKKLILALAGLVLILGSALFACVMYKDQTYVPSESYLPKPGAKTDTLVVYYSRSGNTEAMAREIARHLKSQIRHLDSERYPRNFKGWRNAANDAHKERTSGISPRTLDLKPYRLIFLGAPIWLYRPAPPLWAFVENNDFTGKKVVLFNTFNSRFKEEEFTKLRRLIKARGGEVIDHIYVRRGRVLLQKSREELLKEVRGILKKQSPKWSSPLNPQ